jgi:ubiquinone/menaquinone biosynthesis C-methylase UbiE
MAVNSAKRAGAKAQKGYKGIAMEGPIATWYARNTRSRIEEQRQVALRIAERLPAGGRVLEVAPGPGYLSIELARLGKYQVTGLDISETFVKIERQNAAKAGVKVDFNHGDATVMPFGDNSFDRVVCVAAFKNFTQPVRVINEMYRVLAPGGTALIVDLRGDASMKDIDREVKGMKLNRLNSLLTKGAFRFMLLKNAYTRGQIQGLVAKTNFKKCDIKTDLIGMEIWLEK